MRSTNWRYTFWESETEPSEVLVLRPERGMFSADTIKKWAAELLFRHEGKLNTGLTLKESIEIVHRYNYAKIKL